MIEHLTYFTLKMYISLLRNTPSNGLQPMIDPMLSSTYPSNCPTTMEPTGEAMMEDRDKPLHWKSALLTELNSLKPKLLMWK